MRVEPIPYVYRPEDRRRRSASEDERPFGQRRGDRERRARHSHYPWLTAAFGAHLLGQNGPHWLPSPEVIARAYRQPETRTPLRPRTVETV